jgi:menaquinone-9 beta-reductase
MPRELTIVGGGLAGLTLGIALRQANLPVTLVEAGVYPRHRVCGEFISGRGQTVLSRLNLEPRLVEAGMIRASHAQFFAGKRHSSRLRLPQPAWSISRQLLDALLADVFQERGGALLTRTRWTRDFATEGVVRATGRKLPPPGKRGHWLGLKAHADNVPLAADLEMHLTPAGYVGLSRLTNGRVNVCGLFRARPNRSGDVFALLRGGKGSALRERLRKATWIEDSRCSIAGLAFGRMEPSAPDCSVGDAFAMIPPLTGNGMSMAFESADLAVQPLSDYAAVRTNWAEARRTIRERCGEAFRGRLVWGRWLQKVLVQPLLAPLIVLAISRGGSLWHLAFARTR